MAASGYRDEPRGSTSVSTVSFPRLHDVSFADTRDAQASLRPSLKGLTTGVVHVRPSFELELNLRDSQLHGLTADGQEVIEALHGQTAADTYG